MSRFPSVRRGLVAFVAVAFVGLGITAAFHGSAKPSITSACVNCTDQTLYAQATETLSA